MSRVAWILLLSAGLAQPARAQTAGPCGGFVTHLWVPQPSGRIGSISVGGGGTGTSGGNGNGGGPHEATAVSGGDLSADRTIACATCVVASSPAAGIPHFAGSTQTVTSSLIVNAAITAVLAAIRSVLISAPFATPDTPSC